MLYLDTLKFNNLGRFTEEQVFNLKDHDNLLLIDGNSGSGKSTIFHSLDYLLGINTIPATQLQCRFTKKPAYVEGTFRHDIGTIIVRRCKKTGLTLKLPNETISGNVELAEQKLDELIGVPRKLFKKIIHKPQREFGFFLKMTAKQIYLFLIELLGLKVYQDKIDTITNRIKGYIKSTEGICISLEGLRNSLDELLLVKENEVAPKCATDRDLLAQHKLQIEQSKNKLSNTKTTKKQQLDALVKPVKKEGEYDMGTISALETHIQGLDSDRNVIIQSTITARQKVSDDLYTAKSTLNKIETAKVEAKTIGTDITKIKNERKHVEAQSCPTCKQSWITGDAQSYIKQLDVDINSLIQDALQKKALIDQEGVTNNSIVELKNSLIELQEPDTTSIDTQIIGLQEQLSQEKNKLSNVKQEVEASYLKEYNLFLQKQNEIDTLYHPEILSLESEVNKLQLEIQGQEQDIRNYEVNLKQHLDRVADTDTLIKNKKQSIEQQDVSLTTLKKDIAVAEETRRLIKSYTLQIFQETLDTIGENATEILSNVHTMVDSSIYFEGCREIKTGTIKDEVNAVITKEGEHDIPIKTLSGGERTVVDLAVDLAVIDVIEDRVGKGANFFIIDEPFDGLDTEGKEQYLELLKTLNTNKQIILVDHSPELKEMISDVIRIEK